MKFKKWWLFPLILIGLYLIGPRAKYEAFDGKIENSDLSIYDLDTYITQQNSKVKNLKPNNQSQLIWADSVRKTAYSIVYLHGFSASPMEGDPIHLELAKRYGANLYIPRLAGHGIDDDRSFENLSPGDLIASAKEAIAIGQLLGDKLILMSCSTGSTLALYLAAKNPELVHAHLLFSPNIDLYASSSALLTMPWGQQLTKVLIGDSRSIESFKGTEMENYWTTTYHSQGIIALKYLVENTMTEDILSQVKQPYLLGYYYKDEEHFDEVVSIEAMKWFNEISATPPEQKRLVAFPDVGVHVMVSALQSKNLQQVRKVTFDFVENVLGLKVENVH